MTEKSNYNISISKMLQIEYCKKSDHFSRKSLYKMVKNLICNMQIYIRCF